MMNIECQELKQLSRKSLLFSLLQPFSNAVNPLVTEALRVGETESLPRNTSKRADITFVDSIVASTPEGNPSLDTETFRFFKRVKLICLQERK